MKGNFTKGGGKGGGGGGGKGKGKDGGTKGKGGGGKGDAKNGKGYSKGGKAGAGKSKGYVVYTVNADGSWSEAWPETTINEVATDDAWTFDESTTTWTNDDGWHNDVYDNNVDAMWLNPLSLSSSSSLSVDAVDVTTSSHYLGKESRVVNDLIVCTIGSKIYILVDSGASLSACPAGLLKGRQVQSKYLGQSFSTADGGKIEAEAGIESLLNVRSISVNGTVEQKGLGIRFEVCKVNKPILSVDELVSQGHEVLFKSVRPKITLRDGTILPLLRSNGSFYLVADQ